MTVEFVAMTQDLELVTCSDLVLGFLDHLALEFLDPATFDTDEMVVVFVLDLVARDAVVEMPFRRQTCFDE